MSAETIEMSAETIERMERERERLLKLSYEELLREHDYAYIRFRSLSYGADVGKYSPEVVREARRLLQVVDDVLNEKECSCSNCMP